MRAVQERTELPDLPSLIADRRHSLFGHVCHLPIRTHLPRKLSVDAHTGIPPAADWKRPPGRPRKTWLQQVEEDCGISVGLAQITSQDRSLWRSLRPSAGQWSLVKRSSEWVSEWVISYRRFFRAMRTSNVSVRRMTWSVFRHLHREGY